jgi:hypothetical protein
VHDTFYMIFVRSVRSCRLADLDNITLQLALQGRLPRTQRYYTERPMAI